jgi:hypothetical protein
LHGGIAAGADPAIRRQSAAHIPLGA